MSSGIDETKDVQKALNHYVKHTLPTEHNIAPLPYDRAFYPLPNDIKNHVVNAKRALELDQENLRLKIEEWLKDSPQSTHYFRPYIKKSQGYFQNSCLQEAHTVGTFVGNTGTEGKGTKLSDTSGECTQTLLWVHQDNWQNELDEIRQHNNPY